MGPELSRQVLKNEALLQQAVTAKIAGFYFRLALMGVVTGVALVCLATGYDNPIWPMLITYILGAINVKDKAGKFVKSVISGERSNNNNNNKGGGGTGGVCGGGGGGSPDLERSV